MNKVLFLLPSLYCGGSPKQVRLIAQELSKRGFSVTIVVESRINDNYDAEESFIRNNPDIRIVMADTNGSKHKSAGIIYRHLLKLSSLLRLKKIIDAELGNGKDYSMMVTNLTGLVMVLWTKKKVRQFVYNERNSGESVSSPAWKRHLLKKCDNIAANSEYAADCLSRRLNRNVEVINNGTVFKKTINQPVHDGRIRILVPARISEIKNQEVVIEALALLKNEYDIIVHFAGTIEENKYYKKLQVLVEENRLQNHTEFLGYVEDIDKYYEEDDLLILPSLDEGTPNVILEAGLCKMKVLASDIPMNRNCIRNDRLVFDPHNAMQLSEKIKWILNENGDAMKNILNDSCRFVKDNYSIEKMGDRYEKLFQP